MARRRAGKRRLEVRLAYLLGGAQKPSGSTKRQKTLFKDRRHIADHRNPRLRRLLPGSGCRVQSRHKPRIRRGQYNRGLEFVVYGAANDVVGQNAAITKKREKGWWIHDTAGRQSRRRSAKMAKLHIEIFGAYRPMIVQCIFDYTAERRAKAN